MFEKRMEQIRDLVFDVYSGYALTDEEISILVQIHALTKKLEELYKEEK